MPGAVGQGPTREEAREMVLDAPVGLSELRASKREYLAGEPLDIVVA